MSMWKKIKGGVTASRGFQAAGIYAGIKAEKPDLAVIFSEKPAAIAGTFTTNKIQAAPVKLCRKRLKGKRARAIVINSGSANACTGKQGEADAVKMAALAAHSLGVDEKYVFSCSTGTIGKPLPMHKIASGIKIAVEALSSKGGGAAARAIMTTDTVSKEASVEILVEGKPVRVGGMAKGAGMIDPNMATLLVFLTSDARVAPADLQACLSDAVNLSFNKISVDGDQSTNDTVLFMANGMAQNRELNKRHPDWKIFREAVLEVTGELARAIVADGEGATKFVTVEVTGAASADDARKAVRAVARSFLVKTSWYGGDPNWGRVMDAVGYSGARVKENLVDIRFDDILVVKGGCAAKASLKQLEAVLARKSFGIRIDLHLGKASDVVYTCDCSEEYVRINSEYMT